MTKRWADLDDEPTRGKLAAWAGSGNKLLVLSVHPRHAEHAYLINADAGVWDTGTGIWHSNHTYCDTWDDTRSGVATRTGSLLAVCDYCGSDRFTAAGYCTTCETCCDCGEFIDTCICYAPAGLEEGRRYEYWWRHRGSDEPISH